MDAGVVEALGKDWRSAGLGQADAAMAAYAEKLTREPAAMTEADIRALRDAGFEDRAVLDIAQIAAYFAFVNRLADGLGVQMETSA